MKKIILIATCLIMEAAANGITLGVQSAWNTKEPQLIYSIGYMTVSSKQYQYYEGGAFLLPGKSEAVVRESSKYSRRYPNTLFGFYGGYYFHLMPIFRPGIMIGTALRNDAIWDSADNNDYYLHSYSDFRIDYYIALSMQAGMFSFVVSNHGIGGGLNYMFLRKNK